MDKVNSINGVSIRLTNERWFHITEGHPEMAGFYFEVLETVEEPEAIYAGESEEYIAIRNIKDKKYIVVIYKELNDDGFVITAFFTKRIKQMEKRRKVWGTLK
ncbi:MAG: PBECR2 nuclease fold domain-containing protein [Methanobacterium sp.]